MSRRRRTTAKVAGGYDGWVGLPSSRPMRTEPSHAGFVANGIVDRANAGLLKLRHRPRDGVDGRGDRDGLVFQTEHSTYPLGVAFGAGELGLVREVLPLVESRTIKIFSASPPLDDPVLRESRPERVLSHLVGHESPGSLHHLLVEEGWINGLSSGTGVDTTDFSLSNIAITLTPRGMRDRDQVLAKTWQWLALIKDAVMNDPHGVIEQYYEELRTITETSFKFREMGDPTDFCLAAAERLFDYEPSKILLGSAEVGDYDVDVARAFLERLTPQNSLIVVTGPELEDEEIEKSDVSARDSQWQTEEVRARVFCVWSRVRCYCLEISNPFLRLETEIRREVSSNPHLGRTRQGMEPPHRDRPPPSPTRPE